MQRIATQHPAYRSDIVSDRHSVCILGRRRAANGRAKRTQISARIGARKQRGRTGLLQRNIGTENRSIKGPRHTKDIPDTVNHRHRHLGRTGERASDLCATCKRHIQRTANDLAHFGGCETAARDRRVNAVARPKPCSWRGRPVEQNKHHTADIVVVAVRILCETGFRIAVRSAGHNSTACVIAIHSDQITGCSINRAKRRRRAGRPAQDVDVLIDVAKAFALNENAVGPDVVRRRKARLTGQGDNLFDVRVLIGDRRIDRVNAVDLNPNAADNHTGLIERQPPRVGRKAKR